MAVTVARDDSSGGTAATEQQQQQQAEEEHRWQLIPCTPAMPMRVLCMRCLQLAAGSALLCPRPAIRVPAPVASAPASSQPAPLSPAMVTATYAMLMERKRPDMFPRESIGGVGANGHAGAAIANQPEWTRPEKPKTIRSAGRPASPALRCGSKRLHCT